MSDIEKYSDATFESIKHTNADGQEYWLARELQAVLEYTQWRRFSEVIERAKESCKNSGYSVEDHFANVGKMVAIGSGAERKVDDLMLSRYACYLIVQNGDPRKEVIAVGQTYFAVKTRQQELIENYDILSEEQKRLAIRAEMVEHNKSLAEAAKQAGVETPQEYAVFQNKGYQGLYGDLGMRDIHARKGLKPNEKFLTTWAALSWPPICSAPPRPMKNCGGKTSRGRTPPTKRIIRLAARCARPLQSWAAPCRRIYPRPKRASNRSSGNRRSWPKGKTCRNRQQPRNPRWLLPKRK